jgi:hypothetical protein
VPERLNGAVSKTVKGLRVLRGFESHPLRFESRIPQRDASPRHSLACQIHSGVDNTRQVVEAGDGGIARRDEMRKAVAAVVVLGALAAASVASADVVIRLSYMHDQTARTAKGVANQLQDATDYGVDRCRRFSNHRGKCIGVTYGASVDPANPAAGAQPWTCTFIERFRLTRFLTVHKAIGAVQCSGPGADFIQRQM